jgi:signal transduction histidine kinase
MATEKGKGWYFVLDEPVRVLVVDDDPLFREFASVHLATPVAQIETAADGEEAWERVTREDFGLILVDIDMPRLDGYGLVERIRADQRLCFLPIVMVTGREDVVSIDRAYEVGATSFITKPVNWRQLSHQLRYVLRMSRIEADIRAAHDRAEKTSMLKSALLATVKHEFRTPLTSIIGFSNMMQEGTYGPLLPKYREFAEHIGASGQHLLNALVEMVNYAELVSDHYKLAEDEYRISRLMEGALESIPADVASRAPVAVNVEGPDAMLTCDRAQLARMLRHLVENAIVHGGSPVKLTARVTPAGHLVFEVADKGPGMSPEQVAICLEPFAQGDMSLTRKKDGLGLGLPIAKRIVELHGGTLTMDTGMGQGTRIAVTLPANRIAMTNPAPAAA